MIKYQAELRLELILLLNSLVPPLPAALRCFSIPELSRVREYSDIGIRTPHQFTRLFYYYGMSSGNWSNYVHKI